MYFFISPRSWDDHIYEMIISMRWSYLWDDHSYEMITSMRCSYIYEMIGEGGWFVIFRIFKSILFFVHWISSYFLFVPEQKVRAHFASFHTHVSLLTFFVCFFILFHSCCSQVRVFAKKLMHEFPCPIAKLNGTFLFREAK